MTVQDGSASGLPTPDAAADLMAAVGGAGGAGTAAANGILPPNSGAKMTRAERMTYCEAVMRFRMGKEDIRVKELTEAVLCDFLPATLDIMLPNCEDPLGAVDQEQTEVRTQFEFELN